MGKQTWRALQQYLHAQSHYQGQADGLAGAQTRAAIKAWQKALPVAATGVLDANTIAALAPAPAAP
jgi:peptidoglycan hydrolase-like protein with peptidoglycan-binding domain